LSATFAVAVAVVTPHLAPQPGHRAPVLQAAQLGHRVGVPPLTFLSGQRMAPWVVPFAELSLAHGFDLLVQSSMCAALSMLTCLQRCPRRKPLHSQRTPAWERRTW